jgi:hypothetical protein
MRKPLAGEEAAAKEQESLCPGPNLNGKSVNTGEWKKYYQSGDLFSVGAYDDKGLPTKEWKFYYKGMKLRCKGTMSNSIMMQNGELYDKTGAIEGKGNMMLSMFSIDDKTDEMKDKMIPALPFTYFKAGKKYLEILPSNKPAEPSGDEAKTEGEEIRREFRADAGGAKLSGRANMIAALENLQRTFDAVEDDRAPSMASLKISSHKGGWFALFSTHPPLEDRIAALRSGK